MAPRAIKRALYTLLAATGVGLVLVAVFLLSRTAQNSDEFDRLYNVTLGINIAGVLVLFVLLRPKITCRNQSTSGPIQQYP